MNKALVYVDRVITVLIVGDDPATLEGLAKYLEMYNCRTLLAQNGEMGIERAASDKPDLVFMDVMMSGIDGFEISRRLKEKEATCNIPVILITECADKKTIIKGFNSGAVDYITKPFLSEEITARIKTHLFSNCTEKHLKSNNWKHEQNKLEEEERMRRALLSILEDEKMAKKRIKASEEALKESQRKLQSLSSHLLDTQEKNWRHIALELHDELGQSLTVLKLKLRSIQKKLVTDSILLNSKFDDTYTYVDQIINSVRRLSQELCPCSIEDLGLDESIIILADEFAKHTKLKISIDAQEINDCFNLQGRTFIYRIIQESLNNIQKHAEACKVSIIIKRQKSHIDIQIADDGIGFSREGNKNEYKFGLGLTAMEERARMLCGTLQVYSIIGIGTRIEIHIPIDERQQEMASSRIILFKDVHEE